MPTTTADDLARGRRRSRPGSRPACGRRPAGRWATSARAARRRPPRTRPPRRAPTAWVRRCGWTPLRGARGRGQQDRDEQRGARRAPPNGGRAGPGPRSGGRPPGRCRTGAPTRAAAQRGRRWSNRSRRPAATCQVGDRQWRAPRSRHQHTHPMLTKILIANRGEIAVRVIRACRELGITDGRRVLRARPRRPPRPAGRRGLRPRRADRRRELPEHRGDPRRHPAQSGADGVHPGYGFFSENTDFARAVTDLGVAFIGPPPEAIEAMGDKISSPHRGQPRPASPGCPGTTDADHRRPTRCGPSATSTAGRSPSRPPTAAAAGA